MNLLENVTGKEISVIKDPFQKDSLEDVCIYSTKNSRDERYWWARVEFKNGNTKGEQRTPNCDTFEEVVAQLKLIMNSVNH